MIHILFDTNALADVIQSARDGVPNMSAGCDDARLSSTGKTRDSHHSLLLAPPMSTQSRGPDAFRLLSNIWSLDR